MFSSQLQTRQLAWHEQGKPFFFLSLNVSKCSPPITPNYEIVFFLSFFSTSLLNECSFPAPSLLLHMKKD